MKRCVVNVATGSYIKGQDRLRNILGVQPSLMWRSIPKEWPTHQHKPYAFKAYAMKHAESLGQTTLLWCDACIVPIRSLEPLWEKIEAEGAWISENGWTNYEWTADSAYAELFDHQSLNDARIINRTIPHVVATAFGISLAHPTGRAILDEYYRLASGRRAFCGPWINTNHNPELKNTLSERVNERAWECGPPDVRGHRHDQTALSVIAWRLGVKLTKPPDIFSYRGGETESTILVADGAY